MNKYKTITYYIYNNHIYIVFAYLHICIFVFNKKQFSIHHHSKKCTPKHRTINTLFTLEGHKKKIRPSFQKQKKQIKMRYGFMLATDFQVHMVF
jgi:hypothetical protein